MIMLLMKLIRRSIVVNVDVETQLIRFVVNVVVVVV
jgi:hypothetical protein